jgi:2-keto-3-deoxy-L-rhamnonate aldolase RhmA
MNTGQMPETFKARLRRGAPLLGTFLRTPSPIVCEILGRAPLDAVCLDGEHAPFGPTEIDACVAALRAAGLPSLVRVPALSPPAILQALDAGADGIVVPHVVTPDQAAAAVKAAHFGSGVRGYAGSTRAGHYGGKSLADNVRDSAARTTVIVQIEDVEALDALEGIAATPGLDAMFVGRMDLTVALGATDPNDARVVEAVRRVCRAGRAAGCAVGMYVPNVADTGAWRAEGASFFLLSSDQGLLLSGARGLRAAFDNAFLNT